MEIVTTYSDRAIPSRTPLTELIIRKVPLLNINCLGTVHINDVNITNKSQITIIIFVRVLGRMPIILFYRVSAF